MTQTTKTEHAFSLALVALMRGIVYREEDLRIWQVLLDSQAHIRDYVSLLGLEPIIDEEEGYAYLRQRPSAEGVDPLPRLVPRRPLTYLQSLVLVLLRKRLAEADTRGGETRVVLKRTEIHDAVKVFLAETANEARLMERIDAQINKIVDLGLLRPLRDKDEHFEIRRILKSFVDAQWLDRFEERLAEYRHVLESKNLEAES